MRKMFSKKQIEELARIIAQEVVDNTPRGYDLDDITIGSDLVSGADLVAGKLPSESIDEPTTEQINICLESLKAFIKRGYIDFDNSSRLNLLSFSGDTAVFGGYGNDFGFLYEIYIGESIMATYTEL